MGIVENLVWADGIAYTFGVGMMYAPIPRHHRISQISFVAAGVLLGLSIVFEAHEMANMSNLAKTLFAGAGGAVAAISTLWVLTLTGNAESLAPTSNTPPPAPPAVTQGAGSAYSVNQQGGVTAGTVNIGRLPRSLTSDQSQTIESAIKGSNFKLDLIYTNDPETLSLANSFAEIFSKAGIKFGALQFGQMPGVYGITIYDPENELAKLKAVLDQVHIAYATSETRASTNPYPPKTPSITFAPSGQ